MNSIKYLCIICTDDFFWVCQILLKLLMPFPQTKLYSGNGTVLKYVLSIQTYSYNNISEKKTSIHFLKENWNIL